MTRGIIVHNREISSENARYFDKAVSLKPSCVLAWVLVLGGVSLCLRVGWLLFVDTSKPIVDAADYLELGRTLATTGRYAVDGHPTAYRPIGYPFVLSVFIRWNLDPYVSARVLQIALSTLECVLVFFLTLSTAGSLRAAFIASGVWAIMPASLSSPSLLLSEEVFTFAVIAALLASRAGQWWAAVLSGFIVAGAIYIRPNGILLIPCLFVDRYCLFGFRRYLVLSSTAGAIVALCLAPWTWRNTIAFGSPVLVSTNFGANFYLSHNPKAVVGYSAPPLLDSILALYPNEAAASRVLTREGLKYVLSHPSRELNLLARRFLVLLLRQRELVYLGFAHTENQLFTTPQRALAWLNNLSYLIFLVGFLIGIVTGVHKPKEKAWLWPLASAYVLQLVFHCIMQAQDRFMYPFTALVIVGGSVVISEKLAKAAI